MNLNIRFYGLAILTFILVFSFTFASILYVHSLFKPELNVIKKESILGITSIEQPLLATVELPTRILIPRINVDAAIQQVGITPEGAMEVPSISTETGWYKYGSTPGTSGSAVIAGHYDGGNSTKGVFEKLHLLKSGDKIYIVDSNGKLISFIVRESRIYNPEADATAVFNQSEGSHLNLITCNGFWDYDQKNYSKRLVVFTDATL